MDISSYIVIIFCLPIIALNTYQIIQIRRQKKKIKKALEEHAFAPEFPNTKNIVPTKEELEDRERFFLASSYDIALERENHLSDDKK